MKWGIAILTAMLVGCGGGVPSVNSGGEAQRVGALAPEDRPNQVNDLDSPLRLKQLWERLTTKGQFSLRWQMLIAEDHLVLELGCEQGATSDFLVGASSVMIEKDTIFVGEDLMLESQSPVFSEDCRAFLPAGRYDYDVSLSELVLHSSPADLVFIRQ